MLQKENAEIVDEVEIYLINTFNKIGEPLINPLASNDQKHNAKHTLLRLVNMIKFHSEIINTRIIKFSNGEFAGTKIK